MRLRSFSPISRLCHSLLSVCAERSEAPERSVGDLREIREIKPALPKSIQLENYLTFECPLKNIEVVKKNKKDKLVQKRLDVVYMLFFISMKIISMAKLEFVLKISMD